MKKSQSIFLLSGFVPLLIAPTAIVASCSNDTTAAKTESRVEAERLDNLIQSSKIKIQDNKQVLDDAKLAEIKNDPNKLLSDYLDLQALELKQDKFNYDIIELASVEPKQDNQTQPKTISFKFKVTNKTNINETFNSILASVSYQYQTTTQTAEQVLVNQAVAKIEEEFDAKRFKLKTDKETLTSDEVNALKATPSNFLTDTYTEGFPTLDSKLESTITANNFTVVPKQRGTRQQQPQLQVITIKITITHKTSKHASDTKSLSFDFTLQEAQTPVQQPETQTNTEISVASLALTNATPTRDEIKQGLVNEAKIFEKKDVIFKQGADLITAASDINTITWEDVASDTTKVVLKFKVAANKWYGSDGQIGTSEKDLSITITDLNQ